MTTIHHNKPPPPPLENSSSTVYLRTNNYYGSVGRPNNGRRKSAVELLQESKAYYVKSESVLDHVHGKQDHFSPKDYHHLVSMEHKGGGGGPPSAPPTLSTFPFSYNCGTCPPYPHEHLDLMMHANYLNSIKREKHTKKPKVTAKITLIDTTKMMGESGSHWQTEEKTLTKSSSKKSTNSSSTASSSRKKESNKQQQNSDNVKESKKENNGVPVTTGGSITFTSYSQSGSLYSGLENSGRRNSSGNVIPNLANNSNNRTSSSSSSAQPGKIMRDRNPPAVPSSSEGDSPPPLPPKSPRTTSKPSRPSDFPQRLVHPLHSHPGASTASRQAEMLPPPPPRKSSKSKQRPTSAGNDQQTQHYQQPMTLPSPILPPTPPPDVVMESPMSDSGPIISPPPAFSTPVTPMLDRQNSTVSDRSKETKEKPEKVPLSATVSMSGVSSISSRSHSHTTNEDVSMRCSPRVSSSSPMSHQDADTTSASRRQSEMSASAGSVFASMSESESESEMVDRGNHEDVEDVDGDDDDSSRAAEDYHHSHLSSSCSKLNSKRRSPNRGRLTSSSSSGRERDRTADTSKQDSSILSTNSTVKSTSKKTRDKHQKMPKSVTENFLYHYNNYGEAAQIQTLPLPHLLPQPVPIKPRKVSPERRPILRSKSDLSHRYMKASKSSTLTPGFTLVQVDLGPPPPIPLHNSVSTAEFPVSSNGKIVNHYQMPQPIYHYSSANYQTTLHPTVYHTLQPISSTPHNSHYGHSSVRHNYYNTLASTTTTKKKTHHSSPSYPHHQHNNASSSSSSLYAKPNKPSSKTMPIPPTTYENLGLAGKSELDRFFDQLGLDNKTNPSPILPSFGSPKRSGSESPVFFSSISSIDSCARKSSPGDSADDENNSPIPKGANKLGYSPPPGLGGTGNLNNNLPCPSIVVHHGEPSIVERNARVIKWLFNCRKAMENR